MEPLVTAVLLTTHPNRAAYLLDAVRSFRAQSWPNKEMIVINDGTPLLSAAPDIRVVNLPTRGWRWTIGEKRNVGIRMAHGDWLATWDDDDISLAHRISDQMAYAARHNIDCVLGDKAAVADEDMRVVGNCKLLNNNVMASLLVSRNQAVRSGGYLADDFAEDQAFFYRSKHLSRHACLVMPEIDWYVLRRHEKNITNAFGDSKDSWVKCALLDPKRVETQRLVDEIRAMRLEDGVLGPAPVQK